uniref:Uncharacterized protein n=1 Tax=Arundo donax TaxID=35708 RepID=A0A0A9I3I7_ARUDO
MTSAAVVDQ